ncbi:MAG: hypothetical protein ACRCS9_14145 [Hyphomicrobium sp.]
MSRGQPDGTNEVGNPINPDGQTEAHRHAAADAPAPRVRPGNLGNRAQRARTTRAPPRKAQPRALVQRIYNTIDSELAKLELQKGVSSQDRERASRALAQMVASLEKAVDMQRAIAKDKSGRQRPSDKEALKHAESLRQQIADRLERLHGQRLAGKRSE